MSRLPDIADVARLVRQVAADHIMPRWRALAPHEIFTKSGPRDLVTVADREAEAALATALTSLYPGSRIVGEETYAADPRCFDHLGGDAPVWVIDPIDGTGAFTRGETGFALMLALVHGQSLDAAWILQPASGDLYMGEHGGGVRLETVAGTATRLEPRPPSGVAGMAGIVSGSVFLDGQRIIRDHKRDRFARLGHMACPGMDYPAVLRGEAHFTVYANCLPWDHLPGLMLLQEVGWTFAKLDGSPYRAGDRAGGVMSAPSAQSWREIRTRLAA